MGITLYHRMEFILFSIAERWFITVPQYLKCMFFISCVLFFFFFFTKVNVQISRYISTIKSVDRGKIVGLLVFFLAQSNHISVVVLTGWMREEMPEGMTSNKVNEAGPDSAAPLIVSKHFASSFSSTASFCSPTHLQNDSSLNLLHVLYYLVSAPSLWSWPNTHRPSLWPICGVNRERAPPAPQRRRLADASESIWPETRNDLCRN